MSYLNFGLLGKIWIFCNLNKLNLKERFDCFGQHRTGSCQNTNYFLHKLIWIMLGSQREIVRVRLQKQTYKHLRCKIFSLKYTKNSVQSFCYHLLNHLILNSFDSYACYLKFFQWVIQLGNTSQKLQCRIHVASVSNIN